MRKKLLLLTCTCACLALFSGCSKDVENKELKVTIDDVEYTIEYTGQATLFNKPVGEGEAVIEDYKLKFNKDTIKGKYDGAVEDGIPTGKGSFKSKKKGASFKYDGEFAEGTFSGKGKLKYDAFELEIGEDEYEGSYEGAVVDGVPCGEGVFEASEDFTVKYDGEWKDGLPNGYGRFDDESADHPFKVGHFTDGKFDTTMANLVSSCLYNGPDEEPLGTFSDEKRDFMNDNDWMFNNPDTSKLDSYVDDKLDGDSLVNGTDESDKLVKIDMAVVEQVGPNSFEDKDYTELMLTDIHNNIFYLIYYGDASELKSGDYASFYAYPASTITQYYSTFIFAPACVVEERTSEEAMAYVEDYLANHGDED